MLNHSLSNSRLRNTNIYFQISISSLSREGNDLGNLLSAKEIQAETHMESFVSSRILAVEGLGLVSSLVW